ncbi:MAG: diguanylate cyclase [Gammaproteobacteria bacterium]
MKRTDRWRIELARVLEWSPVAKGTILLVFMIPLYLQYIGWSAYILQREDRTALADIVFLENQRPIFIAFALGAFLLLAIGLWLRKRRPQSVLFQLVCANYYGLTLLYCGYIIGTLNFVAGIIIVGAPVVGFILLERWVVYLSWAISLVSIVTLSYLGADGLLTYAPALVPPLPGDTANQVFWTTTTFFFAAPHLVALIVLADFLIARWRERELAFRTLSFTDALTGVHNRRSVLEILERETALRHRRGAPVGVVLLDLDHFKKINDTWGHPAGDLVLKTTAKVLSGCLRQSDALGRFGGEEFLIVLPDTDLDGTRIIAERCRAELAATPVVTAKGERLQVSASFGIASNQRDPEISVDALIALADGALYRAKQAGRNRVEAG